ncbi:elongation factor P [bacterium]|nr:elongation factor P [bacterium]
MLQATQIKKGMIIIIDGELLKILAVNHVTPGKGKAHVQFKARNIKTGSQAELRYNSDEKLEKAFLETREMEFLYEQDDEYYFMDSETFEQGHISRDLLADAVYYLIPNTKVLVEMHEGNPLGVALPKIMELKIVDTEPVFRGATAAKSNKPATLETGLKVKVPPFIENGTVIRVDTETGEYLERA